MEVLKTALKPIPGINGKSQKIAAELYHLYGLYTEEDNSLQRSYSHFKCNTVYDFLKEQGKLLSYPSEISNKLKEFAKLDVKLHCKGWIIVRSKTKDKELVKYIDNMLKNEFNKFWKSYLVRKQLFDMRRIEGKDMIIENTETGKEVKMLNFI